ncbi:unnamed protein product [Brugia timori]|uniref:Myotubularin phosphatase domain-containing protein n=1 Tax=Brugia timori TaxID=42155 RepID=A0A3P7SWZ1_9BILA|nr:unnamed protein product [Brugia timori]
MQKATYNIATNDIFFRLCATYPKSVIVPKDITDDELRRACAARNNARFPAAVWCYARNESVLLRSSQPCCGIFNYRFPLDEKLLECARKAVNGSKFVTEIWVGWYLCHSFLII